MADQNAPLSMHITPNPEPGAPPSPIPSDPVPGPSPITDPAPVEVPQPVETPPMSPPPIVDPPAISPMA